MTVSGLSLLAGLMPATQDASGATGTTPDGADAFAAMMADLGKPAIAAGALPADDGKDTRTLHDKGDDDAQAGDEKGSNKTQDDDDAALMAMLGVPMPLVPPAPPSATPPVETAVKDGAPAKGKDVPLATTTPAVPADATPAATPAADPAPPVDPHLVLAALEKQTSADGSAKRPLPDRNAQPQAAQDAPVTMADKAAPAPVAAKPVAAPVTRTADATQVSQPAPSTQPPATPAPEPLPATAALLAARVATVKPAAPTPAPAAPARKAAKEDDDAIDPDLDPKAAPAPAGAHVAAAPKSATVTPADNAGQVLAAGTADRQLDLAKQGAWLDGLARDIASTGASTSTVRFQVSPEHLGTVQVEMKRGDDGSAVTLTATSEASRVALADARPQLIAEARAHGIHIANAQVDVGTGDTGSNRDSQPQSSSHQHDSRNQAMAGNGGFSGGTGSGGSAGNRSQTRSQPLPEYQSGPTRTVRGGTTGQAPAPKPTPADARYA
ncbi:flagellar hook-length control protein FliK [Sphingomonas sp. PR090111-T3T-6A]|uniref:flagellar hook-length control protein FliK n=1 Tax=Sphingomonas sp. PR090111-T3T-6A TaxID=685778 RepID=UPI00037597C0|nr:flagellar hook-length control protein FliK [Sphingomonas sp. PR090111-T3T-6A]